jgi:C-terminal processing protease CtpA/Prc
MKKGTPLSLMFWLCTICCMAQSSPQIFNLDFEKTKNKVLPLGWNQWGTPDYKRTLDSTVVHDGKFSLMLTPASPGGAQSFGSMSFPIDANYEGSNVTLEGFVKVKNVEDGYAGLVLRIDGDGRMLQLDNMQKRGIRGTADWKKYSITLPLPANAEKIHAAAMLTGKGTAWFDSFEVLINNKRIQEVTPIARTVFPASKDKTFDEGSKFSIGSLTTEQQRSAFRLAKVWGFLKYHHPAVRKGEYNWDYELFRIMPQVLDAKSADGANQVMAQWASSFGVLEGKTGTLEQKNDKKKDPVKGLKLSPDIDWIKDKNALGQQLSDVLMTIHNQDRNDQSYYVGLTPNVYNPVFKHEAPYRNMSYSDDGVKLLSLFRYWNMIEYYFPYKHLTDNKWNDVLGEFIPRMVSATDELSYKLTLLELIGKVQDSHANIWQSDEVLGKFWGKNAPPITVKMIEGKVVITDFMRNDFGITHGLSVGDVITHVNGVAVNELIDQKIKHSPASNLPTQQRNVMLRLLHSNADSIDLTIGSPSGPGLQRTIPLTLFTGSRKPDQTPSHKIIGDNIGYIYPGTLQQGEIHTIMKDFAGTRGLIVDLRCYPSDFIVFSLSEYLNPKPVPFVKFTAGNIEHPGAFSFTKELEVGKKNNAYYKGKVIIIINESTQSQAEYTTMALRASPNAMVIGSTTAGADGNVSEIFLPGNVRTMISGIGVYYPDGRETQRVGIVPDIEMKPTLLGIRNGKDELLDKAIELINK